MKNNNFKTLILVSLVSVLWSCSNSKSNDATTTAYYPVVNGSNGVVVDTQNPSTGIANSSFPDPHTEGSTSTFKPVNKSTFNDYTSATHPINNPQALRINLNLQNAGANRFGGEVSISYYDNNMLYNGIFKAGLGVNQSYKGMYDNGKYEAEFNYWFNYNNQKVFSGYFEDDYGAITVTLVPETSTPASGNDAEPIGTGKYKGYIYFKNFGVTTSPWIKDTTRSCWFTYRGPADCRSNVISTKCGLFPGAEAGYRLLGTFSGVDIKKAFNLE